MAGAAGVSRIAGDHWGSLRTAGDRDAVSLWDVAARSIGHCGRGDEALFTRLCLRRFV